MKRVLLLSLFILSGSLGASTSFGGYPLIVQKTKGLPVTTMSVVFRVGSAHDPKGQAGLVQMLGRLLREGGVKSGVADASSGVLPGRTREGIEEFLFPKAADINVMVEREQLTLHATAAADDALEVFELLAQMVLAPGFDANEYSRLKTETEEALKNQFPREDEEELGKAALERAMFGAAHPYGHVPEGTLESVKGLKKEAVEAFYKKNLAQDRLSVGLGGVVSEKLERFAKTVFTKLPLKGEVSVEIPALAAREDKKLRVTLVKGPFEAVGVHLGHPIAIKRGDADFGKLYLGSMAFGKHRSFVGRLMRVVREIRSLNYGTYSYVEEFPGGGHSLSEPTQVARSQQAFTLWVRPVVPANACFVLRQVYRESESLKNDGLTESEFSLARSHLIGLAPLMGASLERRLGYALDSHFYGMKSDYLASLQADAKKATRKSVNQVLNKTLNPSAFEIVFVTPDPEKTKQEILSETCPVQYAEGSTKAPEVLKEDEIIARYKLPIVADAIETITAEDVFESRAVERAKRAF